MDNAPVEGIVLSNGDDMLLSNNGDRAWYSVQELTTSALAAALTPEQRTFLYAHGTRDLFVWFAAESQDDNVRAYCAHMLAIATP